MAHTITEKTSLTSDEKQELALHLSETFANDDISKVFNGCSYEDDRRFWHEFYSDAIDRALGGGRVFVIYDQAGKVASSAIVFPPGTTFDSLKDVHNAHYQYVKQHTTAEHIAFMDKVRLFLLRNRVWNA
jgi:hypothetical protein